MGIHAVMLVLRLACISRCIVTDAHDSNSGVGNFNKILHVDDFTEFLLSYEEF